MADCEYLVTESEIAPMVLSDVGPYLASHEKRVVGEIQIRDV